MQKNRTGGYLLKDPRIRKRQNPQIYDVAHSGQRTNLEFDVEIVTKLPPPENPESWSPPKKRLRLQSNPTGLVYDNNQRFGTEIISDGHSTPEQNFHCLQDKTKTITIDGNRKDIRFYDEVGIIFNDWDDPREVTFQSDGSRSITFNVLSYDFLLNDNYKEVTINGRPHMVKFGAPTREFYIDHKSFQCPFGGAIRITLNGVNTIVRLDRRTPPLYIGEKKRTDLVAGRISLYIDGEMFPVFLDSSVQTFVLKGVNNTIKFCNSLRKVVVNNLCFEAEYGGPARTIDMRGKQCSIWFSELPRGIEPGKIKIRGMENLGSYDVKLKYAHNPTQFNVKGENISSGPYYSSNAVMPTVNFVPTDRSYQVENRKTTNHVSKSVVSAPAANIHDLFQKLVSAGMITSDQKKSPTTQRLEDLPVKKSKVSSLPSKINPTLKKSIENLAPLVFEEPTTLRLRQVGLISMFFYGNQCSSCGIRFSSEADEQYKQHLESHFRQNGIKERYKRNWFLPKSNWRNYEEEVLSNVKEREINYSDKQQTEDAKEKAEKEARIPNGTAFSKSIVENCEVCCENFDRYFSEATDEGHMKNLIRVDGTAYHPSCYDDFKQSLEEHTADGSQNSLHELDEATISSHKKLMGVDEAGRILGVHVGTENNETEKLKERKESEDDIVLLENVPTVVVIDDYEELVEATDRSKEEPSRITNGSVEF